MGGKLRHLLIFLLIILKELHMPEAACRYEDESFAVRGLTAKVVLPYDTAPVEEQTKVFYQRVRMSDEIVLNLKKKDGIVSGIHPSLGISALDSIFPRVGGPAVYKTPPPPGELSQSVLAVDLFQNSVLFLRQRSKFEAESVFDKPDDYLRCMLEFASLPPFL
ncbi:hypothetical protein Bbelb_321450 [Branchiostoma belcheri]|nr:hypothetical protein Bbelb_321450 [Branchiostoma belcheri]